MEDLTQSTTNIVLMITILAVAFWVLKSKKK
jgi:LPXTG-motif cell wall-anchored protein